jgi:hypothetical protein
MTIENGKTIITFCIFYKDTTFLCPNHNFHKIFKNIRIIFFVSLCENPLLTLWLKFFVKIRAIRGEKVTRYA